MASTATTNLRLEKQALGDNAGSWDQHLNEALDTLDTAIAGVSDISTTGGTTTLSDADYTDDAAKCMFLDVTGTLGSNATIVVPVRNKIYAIRNGTSGAFTVTLKTASGTGVAIPQGSSAFVRVDSSEDDVDFLTSPTAGATGVLPIALGGTAGTTAAEARTNLGLVIGTNVQAYGATLTSLEALSLVSGDILYATGADTLARLPKGTDGQYLRLDAGLPDWETLAGGGDALTSNTLAQFASTTSAQLAGVISNETGYATGAFLVFNHDPTFTTLTDSASVQAAIFEGDRATITNDDEAYITLRLSDSAGNQTEFGRITWVATDVTNGSEDGEIRLSVRIADTLTQMVALSGTGLNLPASKSYSVGGVAIISDSAGTTTLANIDALDATTEATIEAAIDTLANLASIQGVAFTFGAYASTLLNNANEAAFKAAVNLEAGVDYQAFDADLTTWAGVTPGTGVATALAVNVGSAGAVVLNGGVLGTPSSGTLSGCTGLPTIVAADEATDTSCFLAFFTAATGELGPKTNAGLTFNSNTGALAATSFAGALTSSTGLPLTTGVTGTLPIANGGTGKTTGPQAMSVIAPIGAHMFCA